MIVNEVKVFAQWIVEEILRKHKLIVKTKIEGNRQKDKMLAKLKVTQRL